MYLSWYRKESYSSPIITFSEANFLQTIDPLHRSSGMSAEFHTWLHILFIHKTIYSPPAFIISAVISSVSGALWFFMYLIIPGTSASLKSPMIKEGGLQNFRTFFGSHQPWAVYHILEVFCPSCELLLTI